MQLQAKPWMACTAAGWSLRAPRATAGEGRSGETTEEIVEMAAMGATARETAAATRRRRRVPAPRGGCRHVRQPTH